MSTQNIDSVENEVSSSSNFTEKKLMQSRDKFGAETFKKGFFNQDDNNDFYDLKTQQIQKENVQQPKKKKANTKKLTSYKQSQETAIQIYTLTSKQELMKPNNKQNKKEKKPPQKKEIFESEQEQIAQKRPKQKTPQKNKKKEKSLEIKKQVSSEKKKEENQEKNPNIVAIHKKIQIPDKIVTGTDNNPQIKPKLPQKPQIEKIKIVGPQYFQSDPANSLEQQLHKQIRPKNKFQMKLIIDQSGLKSFWPQFRLTFCEDQTFLMNAKKTQIFPASAFIITCKQGDFEEKSPFYLGSMESNVFGDVLNVFGPGLRPSDAEKTNQTPRELLATIVYQTRILPSGLPREFSVYVKKPGCRYYQDFIGITKYEQEIPLHTLYQNKENKEKIVIFRNRKPKWIEACNAYMLKLGKKAKKQSICNFILEEFEDGPELMLLGKESDDVFFMNMEPPLSPYIAFAVALSNFTKRLIGQ